MASTAGHRRVELDQLGVAHDGVARHAAVAGQGQFLELLGVGEPLHERPSLVRILHVGRDRQRPLTVGGDGRLVRGVRSGGVADLAGHLGLVGLLQP